MTKVSDSDLYVMMVKGFVLLKIDLFALKIYVYGTAMIEEQFGSRRMRSVI